MANDSQFQVFVFSLLMDRPDSTKRGRGANITEQTASCRRMGATLINIRILDGSIMEPHKENRQF